MRILIGEDDKAIAEVVTIILQNEGHAVIHAVDEKTLRSYLSQKPELILLDVGLGGADGGEIAKNLKKNATYRKIPLIIISANSDTKKIAKDSGADGFLLKPFDMDDLLSLVTSHSPKPLS